MCKEAVGKQEFGSKVSKTTWLGRNPVIMKNFADSFRPAKTLTEKVFLSYNSSSNDKPSTFGSEQNLDLLHNTFQWHAEKMQMLPYSGFSSVYYISWCAQWAYDILCRLAFEMENKKNLISEL